MCPLQEMQVASHDITYNTMIRISIECITITKHKICKTQPIYLLHIEYILYIGACIQL
jgi:hypothetical protein